MNIKDCYGNQELIDKRGRRFFVKGKADNNVLLLEVKKGGSLKIVDNLKNYVPCSIDHDTPFKEVLKYDNKFVTKSLLKELLSLKVFVATKAYFDSKNRVTKHIIQTKNKETLTVYVKDEPIPNPVLEKIEKAKTESKLIPEVDLMLKLIRETFIDKNNQYSTQKDDLSNFTLGGGGKLIYQGSDEACQYEALKSYMLKHIAHIYANDINGKKVAESMQDIATYSVLALVMMKRNADKKRSATK